jgi:hypothetical protein
MCDTTCSFDDASLLMDEPPMMETAESPSIVIVVEEEENQEQEQDDEDEDEEKSLKGVGKMIQDLFHHDNIKVNAALDALILDVRKGKDNSDTVVVWGGCPALVHLLKDRVKKANKKVPACDQVSESNELAELTTLHKTLDVITNLTNKSEMGRVGITSVGGVEAVVKVMQTFPKCQALQERACAALLNLTYSNVTNKKKANECGGIETALAAVNNHLGSAIVCEKACWALYNIVNGSKENTGLLISLGGAAALAKVRTNWPDKNHVQFRVGRLAHLIGAEMKTWADEE